MSTSYATRAFLAISGIILIGIGSALLFDPVAFHASSGVELGSNVNLLSEIRAPGGLLFAAGIFVVISSFRAQMVQTSIVLSSLIYLSYGVSRILSMVMDGAPSHSLVVATGVETIFGSLGLFLLYKRHKIQALVWGERT